MERYTKDQEDKIIEAIDCEKHAKREIRALRKLLKDADYGTSLKMQQKAALINRGMRMKMKIVEMIADYDAGFFKDFLDKLEKVDARYSGVFERAPLSVEITGADGGPIEIESKVIDAIIGALPAEFAGAVRRALGEIVQP